MSCETHGVNLSALMDGEQLKVPSFDKEQD